MTGRRHARQAALPPAGYMRERQLDPAGLVVTVPGESGGTEAVFDFSILPGPRPLLAACTAGFARLAGPDQAWRAAATCGNGYKAIREFLRYLAALDRSPQRRRTSPRRCGRGGGCPAPAPSTGAPAS